MPRPRKRNGESSPGSSTVDKKVRTGASEKVKEKEKIDDEEKETEVVTAEVVTDDNEETEGNREESSIVLHEGTEVESAAILPSTLTNEERHRLSILEQQVEEGLYRFYVAGRALREIQDRKLYRETHGTFEAYCEKRFGIKRRHSYQLIDATSTAENIKMHARDAHIEATEAYIEPTNEYQLRPLAKLKDDPEKQFEAWQKAVEKAQGKQPTYEMVRESVEEILPNNLGTTILEFQVGDPCIVKRGRSTELSRYIDTWGIIREVTDEGVTVDLYDDSIDKIDPRALAVFPLKGKSDREKRKEKKDLEEILSKIKPIAWANDQMSHEMVDYLVRYFSRLKRAKLTDIERDVLSLLDRKAKKVPITEKSDESGDDAT